LVIPKPTEIKTTLIDYVIGQDRAKKVLSVAVHNHYKRILNRGRIRHVELHKGNVLMIGSTGTGKTLLTQTLTRTRHVPCAIADATTLTEPGYVGEDVENVVLKLLQNCAYEVGRDRHHLFRRVRQDQPQVGSSVTDARCVGRGRPAGASQSGGRDDLQCAAQRRMETS